MDTALGFVGLGTMGLPMSGHLARAGYRVLGYDPVASTLGAAVAQGLTACADAAAVGGEAQIVFTCLPSQKVVRATVEALLGTMQPGGAIVDCSTISPQLAGELAQITAARDIGFLDAPLSGAGSGAQAATLSIMVGGEAAVFERVRPMLALMGRNIFHLGPVGSGQTAKLCQNLILVSTLSGVMESVALGRAVGIEPQRLLEVMDTCLAPTRVMDVLVKPKFDGRVPFDHSTDGLTMICKDITLVRELAERAGVTLPVGSLIQSLYAQAVAKGHGNQDLLAWYELIEQGVFDR
ncbi:MAG: NAD(P)-dependent oxidoreductase [Immundisolibacter sp.]|uniref:NAD(P)-dependent oxidoreductase n=1 Tax=Immundisolibacter sp. TaxID=1934948 RepID=UPI003EE2FAC0